MVQEPIISTAERSDAVWIACLRSDAPGCLAVQAEFGGFIRRGLGRAIRQQGRVDDAALDDFTQEALIRITQKLDQFRGESRFTTWALAIAIRVAYTHLRKRAWAERTLDPHMVLESAAPGSAVARVDRDDLLGGLRTAIDHDLTPRQRQAVLGELVGMPVEVLAAAMHTNVNALYKLHHDARKRLRTALEQRGFDAMEVRRIVQEASDQ